MAMTKEKLIKLIKDTNSKSMNGWEFDVNHFIMRSCNSQEKQLILKQPIDETHFIKYTLWFSERYRNYESTKVIQVNRSTWTQCEDYSTSSGLGKTVTLESVEKFQLKRLIELTQSLNLEKLETLFSEVQERATL